MDPCSGNCVHGDEMYGDPLAYDGSKCGCIKCPNFPVCSMWAPPWVFDVYHGRCGNCSGNFRKNLVFTTDIFTCVICLEETILGVRHPAECGHRCCIGCFKEQWIPKEPDNIDPQTFGMNRECTCQWCSLPGIPCQGSINRWELNDPVAFRRWLDVNDAHTNEWAEGLKMRPDPAACFLCRANVADAPSNDWN